MPWLAVFLAACGLAYAADLQLVRIWPTAPPDQRSALPPESPHWVSLVVTTPDGGRHGIRCLARPSFFATDTISLDIREIDSVAAEACLELEALGDVS
ncbi:MAG: hypothetical protein JO318_01435 [Chloroflexi bacterium]|nr:hypothetical protein [Chloroflexota bacterium]